jgi:dihydrofolate reductase
MKVVLDMSISPNGMIAREDGDEDWLPSEGWDDFLLHAKNFNNIVMGRETYDQVTNRYEDYNFDNVNCDYKVIVTKQSNFTAPKNYIIVGSPEEAVEFIKAKGLNTLFLIGGGKLNSAFMKRGLVNEIHLTINPYIIGKGRTFLSPDEFEVPLSLISHKELPKSRIQIKYKVNN